MNILCHIGASRGDVRQSRQSRRIACCGFFWNVLRHAIVKETDSPHIGSSDEVSDNIDVGCGLLLSLQTVNDGYVHDSLEFHKPASILFTVVSRSAQSRSRCNLE